MPDLGPLNLLAWNDNGTNFEPALVRRAECDRD
jgi:hypothetical protein